MHGVSVVGVAGWWQVMVGVVSQPAADAERYRCTCLHCTEGLAGRADGYQCGLDWGSSSYTLNSSVYLFVKLGTYLYDIIHSFLWLKWVTWAKFVRSAVHSAKCMYKMIFGYLPFFLPYDMFQTEVFFINICHFIIKFYTVFLKFQLFFLLIWQSHLNIQKIGRFPIHKDRKVTEF